MAEYVERYWRDAKRVDAIAEQPMVARFRDQEWDKWYQSQLYGWERGDTHCWESRNGHGWRMCQVYVAPDPGEGWVLLDPDKDKPAEGDECWDSMDRKWRNRFLESNPFHPTGFYRRRIKPNILETQNSCEEKEYIYRPKGGDEVVFPSGLRVLVTEKGFEVRQCKESAR
jgi:hypothetical protein